MVSRHEQLDEATARSVVEGAKPIYAKIATRKPDGSMGITIQVVFDEPVAKPQQGKCEGDGKWSAKRMVPASVNGAATRGDPVLAGGAEHGFVFVRSLRGWNVSRVTATEVGPLAFLPDVPSCDLSAGLVLLVSRHDDDRLEYRWFAPGDEKTPPSVGSALPLELCSKVPVGFAPRPAGSPVPPEEGVVAMATSHTNSRDGELCLRITWLDVASSPAGERLVQRDTVWTRGETSGNNCTTLLDARHTCGRVRAGESRRREVAEREGGGRCPCAPGGREFVGVHEHHVACACPCPCSCRSRRCAARGGAWGAAIRGAGAAFRASCVAVRWDSLGRGRRWRAFGSDRPRRRDLVPP